MIELGLSITAACLPTLRPLIPPKLSFQGWYEDLRSYIKLRCKSPSARSGGYSNYKDGTSTDPQNTLERHSNSSQIGILDPKVSRMATKISAMHDVEAQTGVPSAGIKVQSKIEQSLYMQ